MKGSTWIGFAWLWAAGIAGAALFLSPPTAAADCTMPELRPTVELTEKKGRQRFSNGYSGSQLEDKRRQGSPASAAAQGPEWHLVGLMGRDLSWEIKIVVQGRDLGHGYCVGLKDVEMILGYGRITVYVDRRYRPGSCEYAVILEHEQQHVQNFKSNLANYIPQIRSRLEDEVRRLTPRTAGSVKSGADRFVRELRQRMAPLLNQMQSDMSRGDRLIDTPESYRASQARCSNW